MQYPLGGCSIVEGFYTLEGSAYHEQREKRSGAAEDTQLEWKWEPACTQSHGKVLPYSITGLQPPGLDEVIMPQLETRSRHFGHVKL